MGATRVRLGTGLRVSRRGPGTLQVGLHAGRSAVLPDDPDVRALLERLRHGVDVRRLDAAHRDLVAQVADAGLLVAADERLARDRIRAAAVVAVEAPVPERALATRVLAEAGLTVGDPGRATLVLTIGAEPRRDTVDALVQADRPHLLLTAVAGTVRVGPTVVPGESACLRCLDAHRTDRDPRHPLVVEQHLDRDPLDVPDPADLQLALSLAARDLVALVEGRRPVTWSATVDVGEAGPVRRVWSRHPRCGCAWAGAAVESA